VSTTPPVEPNLSWLQRRSVGTQLALLLALLVVVLVLSLTTLITSMMRSQIERDKGAALASLGRSVTTALAKNFRDRMQQVQLLVESSEVWANGISGPTVEQALARVKRTRPFPSWIGVADAQGNVVAATDRLLVGRNVKERPWFPAGLEGRYVGDVHEAKLLASLLAPGPDGEPIRFVDFAMPLTRADRVVGVIGLHADVQGVRAVAEAFIPKNAEARRIEVYILTSAGEVIFGADRNAKVELPALLEQLMQAQSQTSPAEQARPAVEFRWGDDQRYLTSSWALDDYAPELKLGWQVLVRQPVDVAYAPARQATTRALSVGFITAVLAVGIGLTLGRQVTKPLRRMAQAARDVERGLPHAVIPAAHHNQELSHLSSALQSMTVRLEQMVDERTAQLNAANHELRVLGEEQSAMLDNELVGIVRLNMTGRVAVWANRAMAKIFGYTMEELSGQPARMLYSDEASYQRVGTEAKAAFESGIDYITRVQMRRKDGTPIWIHLQGSPLRERPGESMWMMTDVTSQHRYQEQVEHIAFHDALTGLPNRLLLADRVHQAVAASQRSGQMCAIAFIGLDGFKAVNDAHGHEAGDHLLKEVAGRAVSAVRAGDTVARLGGDEFVAVVSSVSNRDQCDTILARMLEAIERPIELPGGAQVSVSASIGVALSSEHGGKPAALLASADAAMYTAKHAGKGCIRHALPTHGLVI
jgi:diguanylate cyclase (GGDEF)-like protein/PAS domain S-box-containing protein